MASSSIPYSRLPKTSALFLDYTGPFERVAPFFNGSPYDPTSYAAVAQSLDYPAALRAEIIRVLSRQNRAFGASEAVHENLRRLAEAGTFAVVTGQQVGLFSGPAFTLYKALTAVRLARDLSARGIEAVPLFWLATEDHDLEEVASATVLDDQSSIVVLSDAGVRRAPHSPVGAVELSPAIDGEIGRLREALPAGANRDRLMADLIAGYQPGARWGEGFARFMARVFAPWGVVMLDALDPELHGLAARTYARAAQEAPALNAALRARSGKLVEAGFHAQVHVGEDSTLIFVIEEGNRVALRLGGDGAEFTLGSKPVGAAQMMERARHRPEEISPNALFRPIVQDTLLPTVAYVAGPAELAYHAQSAAIYPAFGRPQPVVVPRASFTLIDPRTERLLEKYGLAVDDIWQGAEALRERLAAASFAPGWQERLEDAERRTSAIFDELRGDVEAVDRTLFDILQDARAKTGHQFERLRGKMTRAALAQSETLRRHEQILTALITPGGALQERALSGVYFLGRAGYELLDQLLELIPTDSACHQVAQFRPIAG